MALSIAEQILVKIKARLALVTAAEGYEVSVSQVVRPKRIETIQPKDYTVVIEQQSLIPNPAISHHGNPPAQGWTMPVVIRGVLRQSEDNSSAKDTLKHQFYAECHKAICDATSWWNWDGLAIDTEFGNVESIESGGGQNNGFAMTIAVHFRTDENNPYNVRG